MVFVYDISSSSRRRKVARVLEDQATRVQYSVFEARMDRRRAEAVARQAASFLDEGDSLRVYAVGADGMRRSEVFGDGVSLETAEGYWLL